MRINSNTTHVLLSPDPYRSWVRAVEEEIPSGREVEMSWTSDPLHEAGL